MLFDLIQGNDVLPGWAFADRFDTWNCDIGKIEGRVFFMLMKFVVYAL